MVLVFRLYFSYFTGRTAVRFIHSDLLQKLKSFERANKTAITTATGSPITYRQLDIKSSRIAQYLKRWFHIDRWLGGITKPSESFLIAMLSAWKLGKLFVPLSTTHTISELSYFTEDSSIGCIICSSKDDLQPSIWESLKVPLIEINSILSNPDDDISSFEPTENDDALVVYTSGTTGRPKAVVHSHDSINHMIWSLTTAWEYQNTDKILHFLPLYHIHGILNKMLCVLWAGGQVEFLDSANPIAIWSKLASEEEKSQTVQGYRAATLFMGVPTVYSRLLESAPSIPKDQLEQALKTLGKMRFHACGSAALPDPVMDRWKALTGHTLLERYGMTEIGMALSNPLNGDRRKGHVGKPLPYVDCKLVDLETNSDLLSANVPGEVRIKGPCVFKLYRNRPVDTAEAFDENGWFKTGDVAERMEDGYYKILGRNSSDIIKSSGYKISALEIERELLGHPQIVEAAVVGRPDEALGEIIVAILVLRETSAELGLGLDLVQGITKSQREKNAKLLTSYLKDKLTYYKQPREVAVVESIPRNHMGKVNKKSLLKDLNL